MPASLLLAAQALACTASDDTPTLTHYGDEMTDAVSTARAALAVHHEAVLAESDLGRVRELERAHMGDMTMRMGMMEDVEESLLLCSEHHGTTGHVDGIGALDDARDAMGEAMDEVFAEAARHGGAMMDAPDMDAALAEEHRHQAAMDERMPMMAMRNDELGQAMHEAQADGVSMTCPMSSHMHRRH